ncbi:unnamed protein product [Closterium sp. Naga37s-1]|nr:unnamed protein product [Closterium sp. Naga37s-1]
MKSFKANALKAVTEATQQSFVASGLKLMTEVIGNVAPGRRGSSPSANDADPAQRREANKQGQKRAGGGDDAGSVKRSKGADGSRGVGAVGPGGSRTRGPSVVDQLKKNGAKVIRSHSKGDGIGSADGGPADEVAAQDAGPTASPLVAEKPHGLASGGKGLSDKEIPTAQTAIGGGARTVEGPSVGVAGTTSIPRPSAAKGDAKDAAANRDGPSATKVPAAANALREMLHRMEAHCKDVQQPPLVDAAPAETARRSVTPQVAATTSSAPPTAPLVAARPPADPKSALLRARFNDVIGKYRAYKSSGDAHHDALLPAIWFPVDAITKEGKEKSDAMLSAMIGRVSMCAAYGKVAASATRKEGDTDEKTAMAAHALSASACAVWCLVENDDAQVVDAVGEGKAAAMVVGASETTAGVFKEVMQAVLEAEIDREQPLGEVAHNVAPALQSRALERVYPGVDVEVEADVIARATVEIMALWGMCPVAGPKLEEIGIAVPCDAQMEYDIEHRGRKGQRSKQGKDSTGKKGKKGKKGRKGKDNTAA